ncbi:unnamed protein product [Owenia fusiformis]|uniref:Uncharacterized protein n=1 Tax=Owenia fusiformis TaxID=6347 RepID=A0A8J1TWD3_OWEFU|nr:unnamed protein product [Owenia fusiformis]
MASKIDLNAVKCKTLTWQALQRAPTYFETVNGGREEATDVILLVSDGVTYPRRKAYKTIAAAQQFKLIYELLIFALPNQYGNDGLGELETMANDVSGRILKPGQFEQLPRYVKKLRRALCAVRKPEDTTTKPTLPPIVLTPDKKVTSNPTREPGSFTDSTTVERRIVDPQDEGLISITSTDATTPDDQTVKPTRHTKILPDSTTTASRDGPIQGGEPLIPSTDATTPDDQTVKPASVLCPFGFHDETHKDSCQIFMSACDLENEKCCGCGFAFAHPDNGTLPQWPTTVLYQGKCYCELCLNPGCIPPHIKDKWAKEKRQWEKSRNSIRSNNLYRRRN